MAFLGKTFLIVGSVAFVLAVGWWYLYFVQFYGAEVKQASDCFYYAEPACTPSALEALLESSSIPAYSPYAFWTSAGLLGLGLVLLALAPFRR